MLVRIVDGIFTTSITGALVELVVVLVYSAEHGHFHFVYSVSTKIKQKLKEM